MPTGGINRFQTPLCPANGSNDLKFNIEYLKFSILIFKFFLSSCKRYISLFLGNVFIRRPDNPSAADTLLDNVSAPAGNTRHSKQRRIKLSGYSEHPVNKAGIQIHISAYDFVGLLY